MKRATLSRPSRLRATNFPTLGATPARARRLQARARRRKASHERGSEAGQLSPDRTADATIKARRNRLGPSWTVLLVTR
jgi:hypothetical protein